ncbi:O-antigen polysaccharide polymerase Wzy [Marinilactibacillus sp. XAAS-LB27]|uniref:O-antigen polysaccharide polymerase Wzy n=1 Tax=Marinilactibacillus sp. XAAS-LB27 TaxID=3114538 RepID=UPI002E199F5D|nr:O-antigen polysaccharide polymerase Wzy [Marinilactibacillus sp. XAAS-LB27]
MLRVNKTKLLIVYIFIALSSFSYLATNLINTTEYQHALAMLGIISIFQCLVTFFTYKVVGIEFFSLAGIFTWLNFLFHLGQPILKAISPEYSMGFDVSYFVSNETFINSAQYSLLIIMFVTLGIITLKCFETDNTKIQNQNLKFNTISQNNLFKLGLVIFVPTFLVEAYIQLSRLLIALSSGYLATFNVEFGGFTAFFATFSIVGAVIMLLGSKNDFKRGLFITGVYTLFYIITMFSGGRMWQVIKLILIFYYFIRVYNIQFTKKNMFFIVLTGYLAAGFLGAVAEFRSYEVSGTDYIIQIFRDIILNNPILDVMDEFGASIYTLTLTIDKTPITVPHSWGSQFITNLVSILPNFSSSIEQINNNSNYVLLLETPTIGGSFIGEVYYSFRNFGPLLGFIVGTAAQAITTEVEKGFKNNNYHFIIYTIMLQYSFISWVRGSSSVFYRNTLYSIILIFIISSFLPRKER